MIPARLFALFAVLWAVVVAGCAPDPGGKQGVGVAQPPTDGPAGVEEASPGWSAEAQAGIAAGEYAPQPDGEGFRVTNRAQNMRGAFGERGLTIQRRDGTGEVAVALTRWGREGATSAVTPAFPEEGPCLAEGTIDAFGECLHRVDYARPGLTEWWENRGEGLEFGFSVTAVPDGDGPLVFELALSGALADVDGDDVLLVREVGEPLRVSRLAAWDERGRELPAWVEETEAGIRLVVDDEGAFGVVTVDPLITTSSWTAESDQASAQFGCSVAAAGDVNGDGFGDVVVGAWQYDNGATDEGSAFVYMGSAAGVAAAASWTAEADQASAAFGGSVASAGDVNGDGYGDLVVGALLYDNGETDEGRSFVYFGSASGLASSAAWTAESDQASATFGWSVAAAGDVNGDGYGDVVVGARYYTNGSTNEGKAYVFLGASSGLATTAVWTAESDQTSAMFGWAVSSAGDVNGDGYGDVLIGTPCYDNGSTNEGRASVYLGSSSGLATAPAWTAEANQTSAALGWSVAPAGDVNGDGYGDVVVGAYAYTNGSTYEGRAVVYHGSASGLSTSSSWTAESDQASSYFGNSVGSAGDVNGDGYGDVVVGANGYDNGATDEGRAYVYLGSSTGLATSAAWSAESDQAGAGFGVAVGGAGDTNGDGYGDLIVGAIHHANGSTDEGRSYVYLGSASGLGTSSAWSGESNQASALFGTAVASAGDVNGDGFADVIVGAPFYDNGETNEGQAYLYLGSASGLATSAAWTAESDQASSEFAGSIGGAGDVNGDGYGDIIVGAAWYDNGVSDEGRAQVYLGSPSGLAAAPAWTVESDQASAYFGFSVAAAGDVNGDGYADVLVGAYYYDNGQANEGRVYVYFGSSAGLASVAAWTAESDQAGANFGVAVAPAGDVNRDGYDDLVVGAFNYDNGETDEGSAFVFLGSSVGPAGAASWSAESDQAMSDFGRSVASAGDLNGDGYGDVVVGAPRYDNGEVDEGRAFVYLGSASGPSTAPDWTGEPDQASTEFGYSVAVAGDVNGDGYGDLVVGADAFDAGSTNEGSAFVYLGSPSGPGTTSAWSAGSNQDYAYLGRSVAGAGDVNGDGFGDVIVGAYAYDNGSTDEGAAFLYMGNGADGTTPLSLTPQARQPSSTTPLSPGLASTSSSTFDVAMSTARSPFGVGKIKVQVEAKPLGTAFDGTSLQTQTSYTSSGLTGASIQQAVTGLTGSTGYHWRARVYYSPAEGRPQGWGPWTYGGLSGNAAGGHVFTVGTTFYADADGDGYGDASTSTVSRASTLTGYATNATDCDDTSAAVNPAGTEITADGIDQDCDSVDSCYTDSDNDNYGTSIVVDGSSLSCVTGTGAPVSTDCDDASATINPAGTEIVADSIDQDCDNVDSCYTDADGDNYGTSIVIAGSTLSCVTGTGAAVSTDCDDTSALVYPAASETTADGIDQDCDNVDSCYTDADNDNYGTAVVTDGSSLSCATGTGAPVSTDCDDASASIYPGATESVADGIDQDCDSVDSCYTDADGDNYGTSVVIDGSSLSCVTGTGAAVSTDCDDASATNNPAGTEIVADTIDQDCDGVDNCYTDADNDNYGTSVVISGSSLSCDTGSGAAVSNDCDDASAAVYPGASETAADGTDQDCDGVDSCYTDADGDGYGITVEIDGSSLDCSTGTGASVPGDCDDADAALNPAATETVADGIDQDCDGVDACYTDADGDNYGTSVVSDGSSLSCTTGTGATNSTDCDDASASAYPSAPETPGDGLDQDCDSVDDCYTDSDGDDYGTSVVIAGSSLDCSTGTGAAVSTDCDDADPNVYPGATETTADGTDADCDGTELCFVDADDDGYRADDGATVASDDDDCDDPGEALEAALTGDCDDDSALFNPAAPETDCADPTDYNCDGSAGSDDADGDGWAACEECNDSDGAVNPDAAELPGDTVDQDCDGTELCYVDLDEDGYRSDDAGTVSSTRLACDGRGEVLAEDDGDCDDLAPTVNPAATELPGDEVDQDCDGTELCYADADADGYVADGAESVVSEDLLCDGVGEATIDTPAGDCDDTSTLYNPGATESDCDDPNDYNCDGSAGSADGDADGFAACEECDDANGAINPDADEVCNGLDDDCDGTVDLDAIDAQTWYADADQDGYIDPDESVTACDPPVGYIAAAEADCDDFDAPSHPGGDDLPGDGLDQDCDGADAVAPEAEECGCDAGTSGTAWVALLGGMALASRRRRAA